MKPGPPPSTGPLVELQVSGMHCAGCSDSVGTALRSVPGVASADVSYAAGLALVRGQVDVAASREWIGALTAAVRAAGYSAAPAGATAERAAWRAEVRAALAASLLAAVAWLLHHFGVPRDPTAAAWTGAALAVVAVVGPGRSFLRGAWQAVKTRRGNMDLLVAIGAGAAAIASLLVAAKQLPPAFDHGHAAVWLVAFLRVGKLLEARVRARASSNLLALLDALPAKARRLDEGGVEQERDANELVAGDRLVVLPSERIAADGIVVAGRSTVDEAAVTGEPMPAEKAPGAALFAGTINQGGRLVVEVTAAGTATRLGQMAALVRRAVLERSPIVTFADRVAAIFVPIVLGLAAATAIGWSLAGASAATIVGRALATVVISCPCALALATPTAVLAGVSAALRHGILVKEGGALETLARVRVVLFDKTGTLTVGRPSAGHALLDRLHPTELEEARALAHASRHPAAAAIAAALDHRVAAGSAAGVETSAVQQVALEDVSEEPGRGLRARHDGHELKLGQPAWVSVDVDADAVTTAAGSATVVAFSRDGELRAAWALIDELKPGARAAVAELARLGLEVGLVTGDRVEAARAVGAELGLAPAAIHGECTPARKAELVTSREHAGTPVLFVGDGFNDGAALAVASVGAAIGGDGQGGGGTDLARAAGRVVLLRGDPRDAAVAVRLGRATLAVIRQNLLLAVAYNVVAIPWAMGLLVPLGLSAPEPAFAGLAMAASSLVVVLNALRLALRVDSAALYRESESDGTWPSRSSIRSSTPSAPRPSSG